MAGRQGQALPALTGIDLRAKGRPMQQWLLGLKEATGEFLHKT